MAGFRGCGVLGGGAGEGVKVCGSEGGRVGRRGGGGKGEGVDMEGDTYLETQVSRLHLK